MGRETLPILAAAAAAAAAANGTTTTITKTKTAATETTTAATALAPGFRFHPTDDELVSYYLKRKVSKKPVRFGAIVEVDIYKYEPWDLAVFSRLKTRDQEWYFYSALDKKYGNGARMNRATGKGYWKATGKDREVRHDSQLIGKDGEVRHVSHLIGMKKTLVFHSGRAPDGARTNWVMHEYRLVDAELEKYGTGQDAYVLCRIFHKNNLGPPSGNRYAPFIEEEWDDGGTAIVPGVDAMDDAAPVDEAYNGRNNIEQLRDTQFIYKDPLSVNNEPPRETRNLLPINNEPPRETRNLLPINNEPPRETQNLLPVNNEPPRETLNLLPVCKSERVEDATPICVLNNQAPFPLLQYKRRRHNDSGSNRSNASENSTRTTQDLSSSTTTTAATTTTTASTSMASATTTAISALLEFSLMESLEPKESPRVRQPIFDTANLDSSVSPGIVKFINDLQNEVHKISVERETLKLEMMSAHAMINILQSRIDFLSNENEDLKRSIRGRDA